MVKLLSITCDQLKEVGIYLPHGSDRTPISRKGNLWSEIKDKFVEESILPTTSDYEILATQYFAHISALLKISNDPLSLSEAK